MSTPQPQTENQREIEEGVRTDFKNTMSYGSYLDLDRILSAQHPVSVPERDGKQRTTCDNGHRRTARCRCG